MLLPFPPRITVAMNAHSELCTVITSGVAVQKSGLVQMMEVVKQRAKAMAVVLDGALSDDDKRRRGGRGIGWKIKH